MFAFFTQRIYCHLLVAYALGILVGYHWPAPVELLVRDVWLIAILLGALGALWWLVQELKSSWAHTPGYAILAILGLLSASIAIGLPNSAPLRQYADADSVVMIGHIASVPKYQRGHLRFMLQVSAIKTTVEQPTAGSCYVFVKAETPPPAYYTDRVRIYGTLSEAARARNHGQFDYRAYLLNRGTVLTAYAPSAACLTRLDTAEPFPWAQLAHLRERLTGTLAQGMPAGLAELAISVVYGDKITDLDPQIEERFRRAGLTHILVASGTQVSLLIMLMALLFWRAPHDFSWRGVLLAAGQFFLTLTVVLSYAAVAGYEFQ